VAHVRYKQNRAELRMITRYTRTVSIDTITLVIPQLRLRQIQNFCRSQFDDLPLKELELVGFGVEKKVL
jgi:CpeS-like protein